MSDETCPGVAPEEPAAFRRERSFRLASVYWAVPALIFLLIFLVLPLLANIARSLPLEDPFQHYARLWGDAYYLGVMGQTIKASALTAIACLIIGYPVAYFMVRHAGRWNALIIFLLIAPLLTSTIMRTFGWTVLLGRRGLVNAWMSDFGVIDKAVNMVNTEWAVYLGLVHVLSPFMVLSVSSVLQGIDRRLEESAQILGASRLRVFLTITLPLSLDGIATGCILVFVLASGSFLSMLLLGGGKVTTLSLLIYQQFTLTQDISFAAAMGNVLLLLTLICMAIQLRFLRRRGV